MFPHFTQLLQVVSTAPTQASVSVAALASICAFLFMPCKGLTCNQIPAAPTPQRSNLARHVCTVPSRWGLHRRGMQPDRSGALAMNIGTNMRLFEERTGTSG